MITQFTIIGDAKYADRVSLLGSPIHNTLTRPDYCLKIVALKKVADVR